ncbi:hypothetical protein TD95_005369, partial [Thielaviopsis punctulata]
LINRRDHNDYFTPSRQLFTDHCFSVRDRYHLNSSSILKHESLCDLDYGVVRGVSINDKPVFTVTTETGRRYAHAVVLAVGPANQPCLPKIPTLSPQPKCFPSGVADIASLPQAQHTFNISHIPESVVSSRIAAGHKTHILVVGGGLTSVQIADVTIRRGVSKVYLLMRSQVKIKYFDVDLNWMGKYKNSEQARFWSADSDEERLEIFHEARDGGSITPYYHKKLKALIAAGKVELLTHTCISEAIFDGDASDSSGGTGPAKLGKWMVKTSPPTEMPLPPLDFIYFATGIDTDYTQLPYLQTMLQKFPIRGLGGFPCLTEDLMWSKDVPLFMTGKLASLQIGPASPNIGGIKIATERIGLAVEDLFDKMARDAQVRYMLGNGQCGEEEEGGECESEDSLDEDLLLSYVIGEGSKFQCLACS